MAEQDRADGPVVFGGVDTHRAASPGGEAINQKATSRSNGNGKVNGAIPTRDLPPASKHAW